MARTGSSTVGTTSTTSITSVTGAASPAQRRRPTITASPDAAQRVLHRA
jgi:hypothetical protein